MCGVSTLSIIQEDEVEVIEEKTEEATEVSRKRYQKVVVASSVVDMFNSFKGL